MEFAAIGDTIECDVTMPVPGKIISVLKTAESAAFANNLLMDKNSGWRLIKRQPVADPECDYCHGSGERFWHSPDCDNDHCALACGYDDCIGQIAPCQCCR